MTCFMVVVWKWAVEADNLTSSSGFIPYYLSDLGKKLPLFALAKLKHLLEKKCND